ncbi:MAG TPA: cation diffusion facilitator family transporter [Longimicrobiales bacterium]|nr:cation diffusion facilitator family transporter [Longimicrobiales bacterium]
MDERQQGIRRVLLLTLVANIVVVIAKLVVGIGANSLAVIADGAHSSVDAINNVTALFLSRVAAKEPDAEHPYGHAKFETLGALAIVAFLSITMFELVRTAIQRLLGAGTTPIVTPTVAIVMAVSAVVSFGIAHYEDRNGRKYNSQLLIADAAHTRSDVFSALAVLVGVGLVALGFHKADAIVTLIVAILIAHTGFDILKTTVPLLVDERAVDEERICQVTLETPGVVDCFAVRSRGREGEIYAELTITVAPTLNVEEAHLIADAVEQRVADAVGAREVVVHVEPDSSR